nr:toll-like receptor 13 [Misgurnus anguillicaudatus]
MRQQNNNRRLNLSWRKIIQELKMIYLFTLFLLFLRTSCVFSWSAGKCILYYDVAEFPVDPSCTEKPNSASCSLVTDIKKDLHRLPSNLQNLCIEMDRDMKYIGVLAPGSFSWFSSLEYLKIVGCFFKISPEAFIGLFNLKSLKLSTTFRASCCETAVDFGGLPSLKTLSLTQYNLSLMATNVFDTIPQLEILSIVNVCLKDLSEILCRMGNLKSLKVFSLDDAYLNSLRLPNCSTYNISNSYISTVYNIEDVRLSLGSIEHIDEGALNIFGNFSDLDYGFRSDFLRDLSMTGVNKINSLHFSVDVLNIDELCYAAKLYSIKFIDVYYQTINLPAMSTNITKDCKNIVDIYLHVLTYIYKIVSLDVNLIFQFFSNLSTFDVSEHVLRSNDFQSLCLSNPQLVEQLSIMRLNSNNINKIISYQFMCFTNLEHLELTSSNISSIEDLAFSGLDKLKELDLLDNKLSYIYQDTFSGLYELMVLNLQENPIIQIKSNSFGHLINLRTLLLGDLKFSPNMSQVKLHLSDIFGSVPYNLSHVSISSGLRPMQLIIGNITLNQSLDLQIKGQYVTVEDCDSPLLTSVVTLQINAEYVICGKEFIGKYVKSVVNLEFTSMFSDNIGDLAVINQLVHLKNLKLENIDLSKQPNVPIMFHNLTKLQTLILGNCRIFFLDGSLTKDLKALTSMFFKPYNDVKILQTFVEHLTSLKYIRLKELRLYCSCDTAWLISWVNNRQVQVSVVAPTMEKLQCLTNNGVDNLNFVHYTQENCSFDIEFVLFASTSAFLYLFMFVALSYQFVGKYIMPFYYIASGWFREALRMDAKRQYRYDVFISYSSKDERWVMEKLLPNLEQRGPPFLRLCLHGRDFQLGQDIVENITDSIYASRRTLCLVSRNFLRSTWCTLEMQLGTYRLQVEQRDILILVFLEKIPSRLLSYHHRLARQVKTRTYLDWPMDIEKHEEFWDRLWGKLSSD